MVGVVLISLFFFFKQKTAYEIMPSLVGSEMCIRDREVGRPSSTTLYLQSAKPSASYLFASDLSELFLDADTSVDFLYLNDYRNPDLLEEAFRVCAHRTTPKSVFVVHGICYSKEMKALWKKLQADERVGITFDLYDVGLLFFDKTKIKQQYIVNF